MSKRSVKRKDLEFRVDILRDLVNEFILKPRGVAMMWWSEYEEYISSAGASLGDTTDGETNDR